MLHGGDMARKMKLRAQGVVVQGIAHALLRSAEVTCPESQLSAQGQHYFVQRLGNSPVGLTQSQCLSAALSKEELVCCLNRCNQQRGCCLLPVAHFFYRL